MCNIFEFGRCYLLIPRQSSLQHFLLKVSIIKNAVQVREQSRGECGDAEDVPRFTSFIYRGNISLRYYAV